MARPKSIEWADRVAIFVEFRRTQKVWPTARKFGVARSTVDAIIREFEEEGFSRKRRLDLPPEMLTAMQQAHMDSILGPIQGEAEDIMSFAVGQLNKGPRDDDEAERQRAEKLPLFVTPEFEWHLKGSKIDNDFFAARKAALDCVRQGRQVWQSLKDSLVELCGLPLHPRTNAFFGGDFPAGLLVDLVDLMRSAFRDQEFRRREPGPEWLDWSVNTDARRVLKLQGKFVAVGNPEQHLQVMAGVERFRAERFRTLQREFAEFEQLHADLGLMFKVASSARAKITVTDLKRMVCPACPYPEATVHADGMTAKGAN
jgi:hypothetical protein